MPEWMKQTDDPDLLADMRENPYRYFTVENRPHQRSFFFDPHVAVLVKGPNQAGKTLIVTLYTVCAMLGEEPFELKGMLDVCSAISGQPMLPPPPIYVRHFCVSLKDTAEKVIKKHYLDWIPRRMLDTSKGDDGYNAKDSTLYLRNGSYVHFMSYDQQALKSQSHQAHIINLDEAPRQSTFEDQFPRIVALGGRIFLSCTITDSAPWPTDWIDKLFERGGPEVKKYASVHYLDAMENFNALAKADKVRGGRILETVGAMKALVRQSRLQTILYGKSAHRGSAVYPEFDEKVHGYDVPCATPKMFADLAALGYGDVWVGFDYGKAQPTAAAYHYVHRLPIPNGDFLKLAPGDCVQFAEYYQPNAYIAAHVPHLQALHRMFHPAGYIADPAMWKDDGQVPGMTSALLYMEPAMLKKLIAGTPADVELDVTLGIGPMYQANNNVEARIEVVHALLAPRATPTPWTRWRVLVSQCPETCESMASWATKPDPDARMAKDRYTEHNKHLPDAIGYFAMSPALESWRLERKTPEERAWSPALDAVFGIPENLTFHFGTGRA